MEHILERCHEVLQKEIEEQKTENEMVLLSCFWSGRGMFFTRYTPGIPIFTGIYP